MEVKNKTFIILIVLSVLLFGVLWIYPLLLPSGSMIRFAWEEMRVLAVGGLFTAVIVLLWLLRKKKN